MHFFSNNANAIKTLTTDKMHRLLYNLTWVCGFLKIEFNQNNVINLVLTNMYFKMKIAQLLVEFLKMSCFYLNRL